MAAKVSWEWFNVFGVRPLAGRVFRPEEDQPHANQVAVLAYPTWQRLFGGDPAILGKSIRLNQQDYRVVGVMGPDFDWPRRTEIWVPLALPPGEFAPDNFFNENYFVVARARPDVSPAKAEAFVKVLTRRLIAANPQSAYAKDSGWGMFAVPFTEYGAGDLRTPMLILLGAVGFVLLIACSNIGGLILARASARAKEFDSRSFGRTEARPVSPSPARGIPVDGGRGRPRHRSGLRRSWNLTQARAGTASVSPPRWH